MQSRTLHMSAERPSVQAAITKSNRIVGRITHSDKAAYHEMNRVFSRYSISQTWNGVGTQRSSF